MDYIGPALAAIIFGLVMSRVKEPTRRTFNAILVAGASGVYLSGGFGPWELLYPAITTPVVYLGLRSYRFIGLAWFMHSGWDIAPHLWGNPIWPFMPTSSFGCMIFDALIAVWLFAGAPSMLGRTQRWIEPDPTYEKDQLSVRRAPPGAAGQPSTIEACRTTP